MAIATFAPKHSAIDRRNCEVPEKTEIHDRDKQLETRCACADLGRSLAKEIFECQTLWNTRMSFRVLSEITEIEVISAGKSLRQRGYLSRRYGPGRWRKLKGVAMVELVDGSTRRAELHWFEAHGIGKKNVKIKRFLD
jgi:hypothetical protein